MEALKAQLAEMEIKLAAATKQVGPALPRLPPHGLPSPLPLLPGPLSCKVLQCMLVRLPPGVHSHTCAKMCLGCRTQVAAGKEESDVAVADLQAQVKELKLQVTN